MSKPIPSRRHAVLALSLLLAACRQDRLISDSGDGGFMIERDVGSAVEESFVGDRCARRERGGWHRSLGHCMEMTSSRRFTGVVVYAFEEMSFFPGATAIPDRNDLARYTTVRARRMSLGNKQRLGLAAALQHDPDLIVLDEPTNALDPSGVILLREALLRRASAGAGVLVSSHHLDEVARIATRISVIADGRMIGTLDPDGIDIERAFFALVHDAMASAR